MSREIGCIRRDGQHLFMSYNWGRATCICGTVWSDVEAGRGIYLGPSADGGVQS